MKTTTFLQSFLFATVLCAGLPALAQPYPSRPLEIVVHTGPGAGNDRVARIFVDIVQREKLVNQPLTVVNKVGGLGTVAFNYMKSKRGDPHVILSGVGSTLVAATLRPEFDVHLNQFTPLAMLARDPQAVMVNADSPYRTFKDLIEAAKREPNSLVGSYGTPTAGGRMLLWMIERETGARFKPVSLKSGAEAIISVMGGHTHLATENVSEGIGAVESKKIRVLAVTAGQRLSAVPDAPTLKELGYNIHFGAARGFAMPAGVPEEALKHMEGVLERVYHSPGWKAHAQQSLYENVWMGSAEFGRYLVVRRAQAQEFLKAIGAIPK
jgi:putative tricarboxylic transport membrane protein